LPGLGVSPYITTGGDAFYFPLLQDEEKSKAQEVLAETLLSPATQVAFNLKKGSLPVRGDVDLAAANDCMKKGLEIVAQGNALSSTDQLLSADSQKQKEDLLTEFFGGASLTPEAAQERFADIISSAD
ncbi:MAG: carbohydrate ABC transporter substrate-binding protein, partial [Pseudorhizobium sp.]